MPISRTKDRSGRTRLQFEFDRLVAGRRVRARKVLPAAWSRAEADAYDRAESARLYAEATGVRERIWTVDDAVARYLDERAVELKTGAGIAAELASMAGYWQGKPLSSLPEICAAFTKDHRAEFAPATIMNRLRYLSAACRWGWKKHGMGESDPAARVVMPAVRNERQVYIDRRAMLELARACAHSPTRAAIRIAWYSGMRLGEIERAERLPDAFLLADTKNGQPRVVPIHPKIRCCAGIPLGTRYTTGYHWRLAREAVGRPELHFHDLRHSAASALINAGVDLYTVGAILGHRSQASTGRYAHLATDTMRRALERLGRSTFPPSTAPAKGAGGAGSRVEARAGVEPTYSDLQSGA